MAENLVFAPSVARARATVADEHGLIAQPHGGALRPFTPASGAAAGRSSMRAIRREALAILAEGTAEASRRLLDLLASDDPRVVAVAASQVLDRVLGKPSDVSQVANDKPALSGPVPVRFLTRDEQREMSEAISTVQRLSALATMRADAEGEPA